MRLSTLLSQVASAFHLKLLWRRVGNAVKTKGNEPSRFITLQKERLFSHSH